MNSQIIDVSIMSKLFGTLSSEALMEWGIPGWTTTDVEVSHLKRVFRLETIFDKNSNGFTVYFTSPDGERGVIFEYEYPVRKGDQFKMCYTLIGSEGDGPNSVVIRTPSGKALRINIYANVV